MERVTSSGIIVHDIEGRQSTSTHLNPCKTLVASECTWMSSPLGLVQVRPQRAAAEECFRRCRCSWSLYVCSLILATEGSIELHSSVAEAREYVSHSFSICCGSLRYTYCVNAWSCVSW